MSARSKTRVATPVAVLGDLGLTQEECIAMRLSDEDLHGRTAIASDGLTIGEVILLFLDSDAWRVESNPG